MTTLQADKPITGYYDFYNCGRMACDHDDLIMFRFYKPDKTFGSCHSTRASEAAKEREAIIHMGYLPLRDAT